VTLVPEAAAPGVPRPPAAEGLTVTVCRDPARFAALAPQWRRLHARCPSATPFQSHAWLHSWWLSYGVRGRLRVVLVHRGRELVGAAPLMRRYRPLPALVPLGGRITDFMDVLIDAACADEVAEALAAGLRRAARGAVVDLREVRPGGAAELVHRSWRGPKRRLADSVCLELPGLPMDALIARLGSSRGQRVRSLLRKLDAAGVEERAVPAAGVPAAVTTLLRLHALQWRGRGLNPEHLRPRFAAHLTRAATAMTATGEAVVTEFRVGGEVVAANLVVLSRTLAGGYLYGADPGLRATPVHMGTLLMRHGAGHAAGAGRPALSLLRGTEPYKAHWRPEPRPNARLMLATPLCALPLLLHAALAAARARAAGSPRVRALLKRPPWLRRTANSPTTTAAPGRASAPRRASPGTPRTTSGCPGTAAPRAGSSP
jgi:CelD/BcsL family acetyltransferase involved in cellulose biosynthesis